MTAIREAGDKDSDDQQTMPILEDRISSTRTASSADNSTEGWLCEL